MDLRFRKGVLSLRLRGLRFRNSPPPPPLTSKSNYSGTNSTHFVSKISHEKVHDNEVIVSFDVDRSTSCVDGRAMSEGRKSSRLSRWLEADNRTDFWLGSCTFIYF